MVVNEVRGVQLFLGKRLPSLLGSSAVHIVDDRGDLDAEIGQRSEQGRVVDMPHRVAGGQPDVGLPTWPP